MHCCLHSYCNHAVADHGCCGNAGNGTVAKLEQRVQALLAMVKKYQAWQAEHAKKLADEQAATQQAQLEQQVAEALLQQAQHAQRTAELQTARMCKQHS